MYKYFGAAFRERVESYMGKYGVENPVMDGRKLKIGRNRENLDVESMRAAFTLRECKKFEQDAFIQAELSAEKARRLRGSLIEEGTRKRSVKAMALGLQERERKKNRRDGKLLASLCQKMLQAEKASLEKKKALASDEKETRAIEEKLVQKEKESKAAKEKQIGEEQRRREIVEAKVRERQRERERIREEEEERIRLEEEREERMLRARMMETPQQALHRLYDPIFQAVWDMEFFDGSNPFRIVIDRENCAVMGAPDYFDYIKTPMNLTYVREKVSQYQYETLQEFFQDMELIISNALVYNSDPNNPYHKAANVMLKKYNKLKSKVLKQCKVNG
jgi:flagellar biosynthesis GTPase FlhF